MESRFQRILLALTALIVCSTGTAVFAAEPSDLELEPLVVREPDRRQVDVDKLDHENIEIGIFGGIMSVEDFGTDTVTGVRFAYHVTEDFFVEAMYGQTELGLTSFERLSGGSPLINNRDMTYYNVSVGWNLFPGESFIGGRWAFKGGLYAIAGVGSTQFGDDELFTINAGLGYRFIATDWLAFHIDVRDHIFESDLLGAQETKHNIEFSGGLTFFF